VKQLKEFIEIDEGNRSNNKRNKTVSERRRDKKLVKEFAQFVKGNGGMSKVFVTAVIEADD